MEFDLSGDLGAQMKEARAQALGIAQPVADTQEGMPQGQSEEGQNTQTQSDIATQTDSAFNAVDGSSAVPATQDQKDIFQEHFAPLGYKDINEVLGAVRNVEEYAKRQAEMELRLEEAVKAGPKFENEKQESLYKWSLKYDGNEDRAFGDYTRLKSRDISTMSDKDVLEMDFLLKYKNLSVEDAKVLFDDEYNRSYENAYGEEDENRQKILGIKRKVDADEARIRLQKAKEEFGKKPEAEPSTEQKAQQVVIDRSIGEQGRRWDNKLSSLDKIELPLDKDGSAKHLVVVSDNDRKMLDAFIRPLIENRINYGADGSFGGDIDEIADTFLFGIKGREAIRESWNQGTQERNARTVESSVVRSPLPTPATSTATAELTPTQARAAAIQRQFGQ